MADLSAFRTRWTPRMLSVLRIVVTFLYMEHGGMKLFNVPASPRPMSHLPPPLLVAGLIEVCGGVLLLLGVFTRPVAFILSGEMAVAYFVAHAPHGFWPVVNMGEPAVIYCFVFLYLAFAGGGVWALERVWRGREAAVGTA